MHKLIFLLPLCLLTGCGVTLTTSYFKAGIIDTEVTVAENGSRVIHEDIIGVKLQWLPYFSWADVKGWFKSKKEKGVTEVTP